MIKIENVEVSGFEAAVRGMRNPMNSWEKSDSKWCFSSSECDLCEVCHWHEDEHDGCTTYCHGDTDLGEYVLGLNDLDLMQRLNNGGSVNAKYRRFITVTADVVAPLYWWKEFDTYKVGTVANSCSTMHKIQAKEFTLDDFSHEHLSDRSTMVMCEIIKTLNFYRNWYIEEKDKHQWWQMIQLLPSSYNQRRTVLMNYEMLVNVMTWRQNHKLDEWWAFCEWVKTLPYANEIILNGGDNT